MVQMGCSGTARRLFENFKKFSKITEFEFQNSGPLFMDLGEPKKAYIRWAQIPHANAQLLDERTCPDMPDDTLL